MCREFFHLVRPHAPTTSNLVLADLTDLAPMTWLSGSRSPKCRFACMQRGISNSELSPCNETRENVVGPETCWLAWGFAVHGWGFRMFVPNHETVATGNRISRDNCDRASNLSVLFSVERICNRILRSHLKWVLRQRLPTTFPVHLRNSLRRPSRSDPLKCSES